MDDLLISRKRAEADVRNQVFLNMACDLGNMPDRPDQKIEARRYHLLTSASPVAMIAAWSN